MITTQDFPSTTVAAPPSSPDLRIWTGDSDLAGASDASPSQATVWVLRLLCVVALSVSAYLSYAAATKSNIAGCGGGLFDCDHVTGTRWGKFLNIPVGFGACGLYVACLGALGFANSASAGRRKLVWNLVTLCGLSAGLAGVWFISLQVFVIKHLCPWCLVAHSCGLGVAGIMLWLRPAVPNTFKLATLSVLGVGVLVAGQLAHKPETFVIIDETQGTNGGMGTSLDDGEGLFDAPGGDDDVFSAPGMDDDVFGAPGIDEEETFEAPDASEDDLPVVGIEQ